MIPRITFLLLLCSSALFSQNSPVTGKVLDAQNNPISFVTVLAYEIDSEQPIKGVTTSEDGSFIFNNLEIKTYRFIFSFIGFKTIEKTVDISLEKNLGKIKLEESAEALEGVVVTAKKPTIRKEPGKLVFNVENTSLSTGNTLDLLKKTPGVLVVGGKIQVKFTEPVIYMNGKRVYLSDTEVASLLQNTDASSIKAIEVITEPSAKYDGETGTVLNIISSRAISIGYKGSVSGNYEQAIYAKYSLATSHFYKNDWLNFFGSYSFNPRKEFKEDDNFIRYFNPDGSTNSIWNTDFDRTTKSYAQQGNLIADFTLNDKNMLSLSASLNISPNENFRNNGLTMIKNAQRQLDSTFTTKSDRKTDTRNLSFNLGHSYKINDNGSNITFAANYTIYSNERSQNVATNYFDPAESLLNSNSFFTDAEQKNDIFIGQADYTSKFWKGTLEAGIKYSDISSESKLDFFDTDANTPQFNQSLSDNFEYQEKIYAQYVNVEQVFGKFSANAGVRTEVTDIAGNSIRLGQTNTDTYFKIFPRTSIQYKLSETDNIGISYSKSIERPRFENLNPFRYFINENNFTSGNPNLVPEIDQRIRVDYTLKRKWYFSAYYDYYDNKLQNLIFQDNENRNLRTVNSNLIAGKQASFDIFYNPAPFYDWWSFYAYTSSYYFQNEFLALESEVLKYDIDTFGFYGEMRNQFDLEKDGDSNIALFTSYFSNIIDGSSRQKNIFKVDISYHRSFFNKKMSLTLAVDDIFNTNYRPVTTKYLNQDNSYLAMPESRIFKLNLKYNFGNATLRDNSKNLETDEQKRLKQ